MDLHHRTSPDGSELLRYHIIMLACARVLWRRTYNRCKAAGTEAKQRRRSTEWHKQARDKHNRRIAHAYVLIDLQNKKTALNKMGTHVRGVRAQTQYVGTRMRTTHDTNSNDERQREHAHATAYVHCHATAKGTVSCVSFKTPPRRQHGG